MSYPENLLYSDQHEWVAVDGDVATIGITWYAQDSLGEVVFVDFIQEADEEVSEGDTVSEVESVKSVSAIYSPVSGELVECNEALSDEANVSCINEDPYGAGWIFKVRMSDPSELEKLMSAADYEATLS